MTPSFTTRRDRVGALNREAAHAGRDLARPEVLNLAGDCTAPVYRHIKGLPDEICVRLKLESAGAAIQRVFYRCRKCPECLRQRGKIWSARALDEVMMSNRTWFGTLTMRPADHARVLATARRRCLVRRSEDFDTLEPAEQWKQVVNIANRDITLFLKRVRKLSAASIRYLLVVERHKSGLPHWHVLLHEVSEVAVPKRMLEDQWLAGYSHWRLVDHADPKQAFYVCKYISKEAGNRVRASFHYGVARKGSVIARALAWQPEGETTQTVNDEMGMKKIIL